jgi:hypothetical protein
VAPALVAGALAFAAPAAAGGKVVPGAACSTPGATGVKHGQTYECGQRKGETCPHWHWVYNPAVPTSTRTAWPTGPCPACTPTPTPTATVTAPPATVPPSTPPATSPPVSSPPAVEVPPTTAPPATSPPAVTDTPVDSGGSTGGGLPVTGPGVVLLALLGLALVAAGYAFVRSARRPA